MKKITVAVMLGILALVSGGVGLVLRNQAEFAHTTVRNQLSAQRIKFSPVAALTADQKKSECLVANAGKPVLTGAQAACYANKQIAPDLTLVAGGKTYAETSYPAKLAWDKVTAASVANPNDPAIANLTAEANRLDVPALTLFRGEALRGMLLTTYGFSHLGDLGDTTANVLFVLAGALLVTTVVLLVLGMRKGGLRELGAASRRDYAARGMMPGMAAAQGSAGDD